MSESILKAILRLFAIVSLLLPDDKQLYAEEIIKSYLLQLVNQEKILQFLAIYRFYQNDFKERAQKKPGKSSRLFSVKSLLICEQINKHLLQNQKALMFFQILDIVHYKSTLSELENDYIKTLAISLNFSEDLYNNCRAFIFEPLAEVPDKNSVLMLSNAAFSAEPAIHHWQVANLRGSIVFLFIKETNNFFFRHTVTDDQLILKGRKTIAGRTYNFEKGSVLRSLLIGAIHYSDILKYYFNPNPESSFRFEASEIEYRFTRSGNGIFPLSFSIESGQLLGIMGGSGVGKSTLLNLLNGNLKPHSGQVTINGFDVHTEKKELHGIIGYIPQEDLLIEELTVYRNLYFNARLCFGNLSENQIEVLVNNLLTDLDLFEIKDLKVGSVLNKFISGGQRKRLNISLELIREPYLLFVDEPTSGLSSTDSETVMDLLKEQAMKGKLVVINIHQPSSDIFKLFDKLLVLDKGGRPVFFGNPVDAPLYFKKVRQLINAEDSECITCGNLNPEQILQIIEAEEINEFGKHTGKRVFSPDEWYNLYKKNVEVKPRSTDRIKTRVPWSLLSVPGKYKQFGIFLKRNLLSKLADRQYLLINLLEAPLLAFILGFFTRYNAGSATSEYAYIFSANINLPVYIFMGVIVALFLGMMVSAEEIIRDRKIIQRETFLNLSRLSYYNSKVLFLLVLSAIQTLAFVLVGNCIMGIKGMIFPYWMVLFSASVFSNLLGLNISDSLKSVVSIYILIPLLLVPQILLGGAMVRFDRLNKQIASQEVVPVIGDLMASRWAYEALAVHQFKNSRYEKFFYFTDKTESESSFRLNYLVPELQLILDEVSEKTSKPDKELINKNFALLRNELIFLAQSDENIPVFKNIEMLDEEKFTRNVEEELNIYLQRIKDLYLRKLDDALDNRDKIIEGLVIKLGNKNKVIEMKHDYYNESLAEIVMNKRDNEKIIRYKNRLVRKAEPIFAMPGSKSGRAHFYSPVKRIGGLTINTLWFNMAALWLMNIAFFLFLHFGIIRKTVTFSGNLLFKGR
ncbi:MAG: ATP-binding cassette domain-containing protein [Bacteroidales bacterium]|nr:ATP-binding cassette domain-containing protein [Bacteroidales bacterium]